MAVVAGPANTEAVGCAGHLLRIRKKDPVVIQFLRSLFESESLSPHGICLLWRPESIWTHVISDALIGAAYFSIPLGLAHLVSRRPEIEFGWVLWCFAAFILACGTTHFFSIWTLWFPDYGTEAVIKIVTAAVSVATAIALWPLLPRLLALPSPETLRQTNEDLAMRIKERDHALEALRLETAEREKTEEMLRHSQKMEAIGLLTGGIAHDFNNLLTIILANLDRIDRRHGAQSEDLSGMVRNAVTGAERAAVLTSQLLAFARKQPLQSKATDVNALLQGLAELLRRSLGERITLRTELANMLPPVEVDSNQLEQTILNLAVNAKDAMPDGGVLTIRTRVGHEPSVSGAGAARRRGIFVEVEDTGTGMTPEIADRAFEPFFTTKPVGQGTGLGLSQVYGFVTQSRGAATIESEPGRGTRIVLWLPAMTQSAVAKADGDLPAFARPSPQAS